MISPLTDAFCLAFIPQMRVEKFLHLNMLVYNLKNMLHKDHLLGKLMRNCLQNTIVSGKLKTHVLCTGNF